MSTSKNYFISNCYSVDRDKADGDMVWEVGRIMDRSRVCLCYSEMDAEMIVDALEMLIADLNGED